MVEHGWDCLDGDPSYCYKSLRPWIIDYNISDDNSIIHFTFNTTMLIQSTWTKDVHMTVEISGPLASYDYTWTLVNATKHMSVVTDTFYIQLDYSGQYFDYDWELVTVTFHDQTQIVDSTNKFYLVDTAFQLFLNGQEYKVESWQAIGLWLFVIFYVLLIGISLGLLFLGFTGWIAVDMI